MRNPYNLYDALAKLLPDSNPRKGERLHLVQGTTDYYFGLELEASFTQTPNGHDAWGHDIIYEFTGDDDFWLYVDGELIIDLGGIHGALPGDVNYCTGDVNVNGTHTSLYEIFKRNYEGRGMSAAQVNAALAEKFTKKVINDVDHYVFSDYSEHTMRIFYMERGAGASNLHMRFTLASVKPGTVQLSKEISGVDSTESYMADYLFQIYYKAVGDDETPKLLDELHDDGSHISVNYKDSSKAVRFEDSYTPTGSETTYSHVFILRPGETGRDGKKRQKAKRISNDRKHLGDPGAGLSPGRENRGVFFWERGWS